MTKYDPAYRDHRGAFRREDWTSISDIGRTFDNAIFTEAEYRRVEDAYASVAIAFLRESAVSQLSVVSLENHLESPLPFGEGAQLALSDVENAIRRLLREEFWCRLENEQAFVHIGRDYYMYVGVPVACPGATALAGQLGLFVEPFVSPHSERT